MSLLRRPLYVVCFVGMSLTAAAAFSHVGRLPLPTGLGWVALLAALTGVPGIVHRRWWPLALALIPAGAYLVLRAQLPVPADVHGLGGQIDFLARQLRAQASLYTASGLPLDPDRFLEVRAFLSLALFGAIALASFAALGLRRPLPAVVVLLVVLGFGFTIDETARTVWPPFAFIVLVGCLLTLSRALAHERWRPSDAVAGSAVAVLAAVVALAFLSATSVEASAPWKDWRSWGLASGHSSSLAFEWMLDYPSLLDPRDDEVIMRVESPVASYWRANALDTFDGTTWSSRDPFGHPLRDTGSGGSSKYAVRPSALDARGRTVREEFTTRSLYTDFLFSGGSPRALVSDEGLLVSANGVPALRLRRPVGPTLSYSVTAVVPRLKPAELVGRGIDYPDAVSGRYTALPFAAAARASSTSSQWRSAIVASPGDREWLGLYDLNRRIIGGATDPYEIALRIERYLRSNYTYSLKPPPSDFDSPYAAFLFRTKTGYCQHFAGAMAVLLRFNGIPSRVAVGFATGTRAGAHTFVVRRTDAHSWVEAYFPGVGWATFDPTPGRSLPGGGTSSGSAGFVDPFGDAASSATAAGVAGKSPSAVPRAPARDVASGGGPASSASGDRLAWLAWPLAFVAALLAWPFVRGAVRRRRLRVGSTDTRLRTGLALVYAELRDHGLHVPRSQTLVETSRFLKDYLDLDTGRLTDRVEAVLYGGRAAEEADLEALAGLRRELRRSLRAKLGWSRAVLARYGLGARRDAEAAAGWRAGVPGHQRARMSPQPLPRSR